MMIAFFLGVFLGCCCNIVLAVPEGCDKLWMRFDQSCYYFGTSKVNWVDAAETCNNYGAKLVTLESKTELMFVKNKAQNLKGSYWIGANDIEKEGNWIWVSNSLQVKLTDWKKGQPDGALQQQCVLMYEPSVYEWHDSECLVTKAFYICEKKTKKTEEDTCNGRFKQQWCNKIKSLADIC